MKRYIVILLILLINLNATPFYKLIKEYKQAYSLYINEETEEANKKFKKIFLDLYKMYENDNENPIINYYIGQMFFQGLGIKKDLNKAEKFLEKSYELGTDKAVCELYIIEKMKEAKNKKKLENFKKIILNTEYIRKYCLKNYKNFSNLLK